MFSCEYCEFFKNTYFEKHLQTAASPSLYMQWLTSHWRRSGVFIVNFEHISHLALAFLLLIWTCNCRLVTILSHYLYNVKHSCVKAKAKGHDARLGIVPSTIMLSTVEYCAGLLRKILDFWNINHLLLSSVSRLCLTSLTLTLAMLPFESSWAYTNMIHTSNHLANPSIMTGGAFTWI